MTPALDHFFRTSLPGPEGWAYKLALIAGLTTVLSLVVTLLTPPTEKEHIHRFYRRVKPYGPGWAKVRREKFFHQSTRLAGAGFDYHGKPMVILRGRVVDTKRKPIVGATVEPFGAKLGELRRTRFARKRASK